MIIKRMFDYPNYGWRSAFDNLEQMRREMDRQFSLAEVIDQSKIDAELNNGILRLALPKADKAMPRQIAVKAG